MNALDDRDTFISSEAEEIEQIQAGYKWCRIAIMVAGAGFCAIELLLTLKLIISHW